MIKAGIDKASRSSPGKDEAAFVRETFKWVLIGAFTIFILTTILTTTGLAASLGQDEDILFFLRIASLVAAIALTIGLMLT